MKNRPFHLIALAMCLVFITQPLLVANNNYFYLISNNVLATILLITSVLLMLFSYIYGFFIKSNRYGLLFLSCTSGTCLLALTPLIISNVIDISDVSLSNSSLCLITIGIIFSFSYFRLAMDASSLSIKDIVEIGLFVAIAIVLDMPFFKIRIGQNGGSISLTMVPLIIICLRKGFVKGLLSCGLIFGLIDCMIDPYSFISFPFDYLLAFGSLSIVGLFTKFIFNKKDGIGIALLVISVVIACSCRLLAHTLSGLILYQPISFIESLSYNALYVLPSMAASIVILVVLFKPLKHFSFKDNKE